MNAHQIEAPLVCPGAGRFGRGSLTADRKALCRGMLHAQQATEKALKAVLFSQGSRVVWGHSVRELGPAMRGARPGLCRDGW